MAEELNDFKDLIYNRPREFNSEIICRFTQSRGWCFDFQDSKGSNPIDGVQFNSLIQNLNVVYRVYQARFNALSLESQPVETESDRITARQAQEKELENVAS